MKTLQTITEGIFDVDENSEQHLWGVSLIGPALKFTNTTPKEWIKSYNPLEINENPNIMMHLCLDPSFPGGVEWCIDKDSKIIPNITFELHNSSTFYGKCLSEFQEVNVVIYDTNKVLKDMDLTITQELSFRLVKGFNNCVVRGSKKSAQIYIHAFSDMKNLKELDGLKIIPGYKNQSINLVLNTDVSQKILEKLKLMKKHVQFYPEMYKKLEKQITDDVKKYCPAVTCLTLTGLPRQINRGQHKVPLIKNGSEYYISNQALDF